MIDPLIRETMQTAGWDALKEEIRRRIEKMVFSPPQAKGMEACFEEISIKRGTARIIDFLEILEDEILEQVQKNNEEKYVERT